VAATSQPGSVDVAVIGAGVIGLSVAYRLAANGSSVLVVDRAGIAAGASGVQPGGVRQQWATRVNCLLARESLAFYREIGARLETRLQPRFSACGYAFVAHSQARLAELARAVSLQQALGIPARLLTAAETAEAVPELDPTGIRGAAWCGEDGYFDRAQEPVEAFAEAAERHGATMLIAEVTGLERDGGGWLLATRRGGAVRAHQVVIAAACESVALLDAATGARLPVRPERRYLFLSEPIVERLLEPLVVATEIGFAAKQLADGRVLASDLRAEGDPQTESERWRHTVRSGTETLLPRLQAVTFSHLVEGTYDLTPDRNPLLGQLEGSEGVWIATGFSGHGFMLAPAVSRLLAEALASGRPELLPAEFEPGRFAHAGGAPETQIV
jgi:sarcosine oxidase subunit beta